MVWNSSHGFSEVSWLVSGSRSQVEVSVDYVVMGLMRNTLAGLSSSKSFSMVICLVGLFSLFCLQDLFVERFFIGK